MINGRSAGKGRLALDEIGGGDRIAFFQGSATVQAEVEGLVDFTIEHLGLARHHGVCNAGGTGRSTSIEGKHGKPNVAGYTATKHAVNGFVKAVAREVGRDGITVNSICPRLVLTDMVHEKAGQALGVAGVEGRVEHYTAETALGRCVTVEEIAAFCVHLASDEGGGFSGANLCLDGGTAYV